MTHAPGLHPTHCFQSFAEQVGLTPLHAALDRGRSAIACELMAAQASLTSAGSRSFLYLAQYSPLQEGRDTALIHSSGKGFK